VDALAWPLLSRWLPPAAGTPPVRYRVAAVTYQPASRYWPLQWAELSLFLALALVLAGFCSWWIRRRLPG
jgi:hypothetical protein